MLPGEGRDPHLEGDVRGRHPLRGSMEGIRAHRHQCGCIRLPEPEELADLDRYLDVSKAEFLFAKAVILVEGVADAYVLRSVAERLGSRSSFPRPRSDVEQVGVLPRRVESVFHAAGSDGAKTCQQLTPLFGRRSGGNGFVVLADPLRCRIPFFTSE